MEPLLGPVEFSNVTRRSDAVKQLGKRALAGIDWVIGGGESGHGARPMHPDWARSLRDQCAAAGVPFLFKQWGEWAPDECQGPNVWQHLERPRARWHEDHFDVEPANSGWPDDENLMFRLGKKAAGRLLDGREHNEFPSDGARQDA
jgi:protein gp37